MFPHRCYSIAVFFIAFIPSTGFGEVEWPQFRGPSGQGHAEAQGLPTTWSESENIAWKTPLPGRGWSSPVIGGDEIWMTTAVETPVSAEEKERRLIGNTGNQPLTVSGPLSLRALCVDRRTGKLIHNVELLAESQPQPTHTMNSFASPTPVLEDGKLYCHFGTHGTACLDTSTRKLVWTNRELPLQHENGAGSSPVLWGNVLIFHCDGSDVQYVVALEKRTGKVAWKSDRSGKMNDNPQLKKAYGTPLIVDVAGQPQVISPGSDWLYGYEPATGRELWKLSYGVLGFSIVPRPVAGHGMIYMCTSFMQSELLAIKLDGASPPTIAWRFGKQAPRMASPLLVGDELYLVSDSGIATCLDAHFGKPLWTERLDGSYAASPLFADGKIFFCNRDGQTTVIAPGKMYREFAVNKLDGALLASPAALNGALYLRSDKAIYRIEQLKR